MSCSSFNANDELTVWTQMNVGPDLDPNRLTLIVFLKEVFFLKKFILKKSQQTTTKARKTSQHA